MTSYINPGDRLYDRTVIDYNHADRIARNHTLPGERFGDTGQSITKQTLPTCRHPHITKDLAE
jgi:hypothetical protein